MKTIKYILITIIALLFIINTTTGQVFESSVKYRITAYKNGDNTTFSRSNEAEALSFVTLFIPNTFTPNGDGLNDMFGPIGEGISEFNMLIYNRWGQLIFESNNINEQWDGKYMGKTVQTDAYAYMVRAKGYKKGRFSKTGTVKVIL
ncbi:MAG TPA: gliding motility-associated C-terminal domain-containing protein [bacterium]|nr:gliding motility-associated C-terminal domain-containing protein [bacterium]